MDKVVRLNVGGTHYDTSYSTLTIIPDTMLAKLVSGKIPTLEIDGRIFIDRNGRIFEYILDFLRDSTNWVVPADEYLVKRIHTEANFYGIVDLMQILKKSNDSTETFMVSLKKLHTFRPNKRVKDDHKV